MRPPLRSELARLFLAIALLILLPPAAAGASEPAAVVAEFFERYAAGDARGAAALWAAGTPGGEFLRQHARRMERRCMRIEALTVEPDPADLSRVTTAQTLAVGSRRPGSPQWTETSRSRFVLVGEGEEWRITAWQSLEGDLLERFVAARDSAERASILAGSPARQTTAFVRLASQRVINLTNERRFAEAADLSAAAMRIGEELGEPAAMSAALSARSVLLRVARNELETSIDMARESVSIAAVAGDPDMHGRALLRLARARELVDGVPDLESLRDVVALADELDDPSLAPMAAAHLSRAYELRNEIVDAFRYAALASRFAEETTDPAAVINAGMILGGLHLAIGNDLVAEQHFRRVYDLSLEAGFPGGAALAIGSIANSKADRQEAVRLVTEGLEKIQGAPSDRQWLLRARAGLLTVVNRLAEAKRDVQEALAMGVAEQSARQDLAYQQAAIAEMEGDYDAALALVDQARGPNVLIDRAARAARARVLLCLGRHDEARVLMEEYLEAHTTAAPEPQRSLFRGRGQREHRLLVQLLIEQGRVAEAISVAEQMKAAALQATLARRGIDRSWRMTEEERKTQRSIEDRIRALNRSALDGNASADELKRRRAELAQAQNDLIDFRQKVYATRAPGLAVPEQQQGFRPEDLPPQLDDVTIAVYVDHEELTSAFVIQPKRNGRRQVDVRWITSGGRQLAARIARFAAQIEQRNLHAPAATAEMYELLVAPIEPLLGGATSLCVVPDSSLWHVPFHALGPRGGPLLIERMPVFYTPSLTVLAATESRGRQKRRGGVLAVANPRVTASTASLYRTLAPDSEIGAIPETEAEVHAIREIYGRSKTRVYVGEEARESVLKREAPDHDILHIATHGLMRQSAPMFSSLLLTAAPDDAAEDGLLEAREIAELELNADVAILSACETGKAEDLTGDGVVGFSWALLAAGARTTVVSQWKAQSAATERLMVEFHRQLAGGASKAEALRRAQLALRRHAEYRHPFYWAPFIIIGAR